jgi:hypothetical protein
MAQFTKLAVGLVASSCLQLSLAGRVSAQFATDLDVDRSTVSSAVNLQRIMPMPSDLDQYQDPGLVRPSHTSPVSPTNSTNFSGFKHSLKPAINAPIDTTSAASTPILTGASSMSASASEPSAPSDNDGRALAQAQPAANNDILPTDLTPVRLPERNNTFNGFDAFKTRGLFWLPSKFFFDFSLENSLRFELNTFQTNRHYLSDMVYRVLPNISAGYALTKKTRVSANYFFLRDQYDKRNKQLSRNIQSVGGRIDHDIKLGEKTTLTTGFMNRVLFINTSHQPGIVFNDLLPSGVITRRVNGGVIYGSVIGQIRFRDILSKFQEGDQFYSLGGAWRRGRWTYLADSTLVTNFGNRHLRQGPNNQNIIMTFEVGRKILPCVTAFARAQPIFNMGANHSPGYAGFNFRIFGGIRAEIGKPPIFPIKLKS